MDRNCRFNGLSQKRPKSRVDRRIYDVKPTQSRINVQEPTTEFRVEMKGIKWWLNAAANNWNTGVFHSSKPKSVHFRQFAVDWKKMTGGNEHKTLHQIQNKCNWPNKWKKAVAMFIAMRRRKCFKQFMRMVFFSRCIEGKIACWDSDWFVNLCSALKHWIPTLFHLSLVFFCCCTHWQLLIVFAHCVLTSN